MIFSLVDPVIISPFVSRITKFPSTYPVAPETKGINPL